MDDGFWRVLRSRGMSLCEKEGKEVLKYWTIMFFFDTSYLKAWDHAERKAFVPAYVARSCIST